MDLYYIVSSDIYNIIVNYIDHHDVITIYNMTRHLRLYERNNYLASVFRCIEIARESNLSYYNCTILLNIALLKGEMSCLDYIFSKTNEENDIIINGTLLRKTIEVLKIEPINADIPVDIYAKYSEYYALKIKKSKFQGSQKNTGSRLTDILCVDMVVNGFYETYSIFRKTFDQKTVPVAPKLITNVVSKMDPVAMRMIQMDKFLELRPFGDLDFNFNQCINKLELMTRYPGSVRWFNWITNVIGIYPIVNESALVFLQSIIARDWTWKEIAVIKNMQKLANSFRKYNIYDDMDDIIDADFPLDGIFHRISLYFLYMLETEINIKKNVNLINFFSTAVIDNNLIKYLDKNYNLEFRYVKVPDMSTMKKGIIMKRLTYLSKMRGKSGPVLRYIVLKLLSFAHKNNVDYIYLDSIISNIGTDDNITLYIINTMVYQQEIITMGYHKKCCPAIGLKYHRQVTFYLNNVY